MAPPPVTFQPDGQDADPDPVTTRVTLKYLTAALTVTGAATPMPARPTVETATMPSTLRVIMMTISF
jgi:hypothetical protein